MNMLPSGCRYSDFNVFPSNWNTTRASIKKQWRIEYRFYDPAYAELYPDGYQKFIKSGINRIKDLVARQQLLQDLYDQEIDLLVNQGYNPIANKLNKAKAHHEEIEECEDIIDPNTPFIKALRKALDLKEMASESKKDISNKIPHIENAAKMLRVSNSLLADMSIKDIRRKHVRALLKKIGENKGEKWSNNTYNRYRSDLRILFKELNVLEAMELNPIEGIDKKKYDSPKRETLGDPEQRKKIDLFLKERYYTFWRFLHIFYHSGCRETEMVLLERQHVNITAGTFTILVKKGEQYRWVTKAINDNVKYLWEEVIREAESLSSGGSEEKLFIFNEGLAPMWRDKPIRSEQISRRWYRLVKMKEKELGFKVTADFYSLKHLNTTTEVNNEVLLAIDEAQRKAARRNGQTTTAMVRKIYDTNNDERLLELSRRSSSKFA